MIACQTWKSQTKREYRPDIPSYSNTVSSSEKKECHKSGCHGQQLQMNAGKSRQDRQTAPQFHHDRHSKPGKKNGGAE